MNQINMDYQIVITLKYIVLLHVIIKDDKTSKALVYDREVDVWLKREKDGVVVR